MRMRSLMTFVVAGLIALPSLAQQHCTSIIAASRILRSSSADQSEFNQHANNFCSAYNSKSSQMSSTSVEASYKVLSASFSSSNASYGEVASRYCSAAAGTSARSDAFRNYVEAIAPGAYEAYQACLRVGKELQFVVNEATVLPRRFDVAVAYTAIVQNTTAKLLAVTSGAVKCRWNDESDEPRIELVGGSKAMLVCNRESSAQRDFVRIVRVNDGDAEAMISLPWGAYDEKGTPVDALAALQHRVAALQASLDKTLPTLQSTLDHVGGNNCKKVDAGDKAPLEKELVCGAGEYLRGIFMQHKFGEPEFWKERVQYQCCSVR